MQSGRRDEASEKQSSNIIASYTGWRHFNQVLHDLSLLTVGVGRNQLDLSNVAANWFALGLNAAAVLLHSQAS